ncbi:MAG: glycosyl transferase group 1 [Firmicutes bacterium]|nr:glycosyl transferase group 1 [Bacillota bacterium]
MSDDIEYAFLGGLFPKQLEYQIKAKSKGPLQYAANTLQWNFVSGIESNIGYPVKLLNCMFIGSFPKRYRDAYVKTQKFSHSLGSDDINIGFLNITVLKQILIPISIKKALKKWILNNSNRQKVLFVYSSNYVESINYVKKINHNIHICLILPDLPMYMNLAKHNMPLYKLINCKNQRMLEKTLQNIDSFVFLTEQMSKYLKIDSKPYIVIEGVIGDCELLELQRMQNDQTDCVKRIVYTGTLIKKYGIIELLKAFREIEDENLQLIICGGGEAAEDIKKASENDLRIIYKGVVSPQEARQIQLNATVLVNPRQNIGEYTKYSFPSKIMEYMLSGVPVICYKLDGIPSEYNDYLLYVKPEADKSHKNLKNKIMEICSLSTNARRELGIKGREFVLNNKNKLIQSKKVLEMILRDINKNDKTYC